MSEPYLIGRERNPLLRDMICRLLEQSEGLPANKDRVIEIFEKDLLICEPTRSVFDVFAHATARHEIPAEEQPIEDRINMIATKYHLRVTRHPGPSIRFRATGPRPVGNLGTV